ncbi:MAG: alpha/beta hydrolase fold domain-containing protein [Novosphingobium sp.]
MAGTPVQPPFAMTVSAEARAVMEPLLKGQGAPEITATLMRNPLTRAGIRLAVTQQAKPLVKARARRFGVTVGKARIAGVPVRLVRKQGIDPAAENRLLINFHGGGFMLDAGSLTETIPLAGLTGIPTIAVLYRMAPEHPFPAAVDDALAVYRDALAQRPASAIGVFGTSAGAVLTLQLLARIKAQGLPMPAAAGVFSGAGDLGMVGDCEAYLPPIMGARTASETLDEYCADTPRDNPLLSPQLGDLTGLPPTMLMTSTRDQLLSHTILVDLALRRAGVAVDLRVYEGMAHAFWGWIDCPESEIALAAQAEFFTGHLAR